MDTASKDSTRSINRHDRIRDNTPPGINARIDRDIEMRVMWYAAHARSEVDGRLHELDEEWCIERALETKASLLALTGAIFGNVSGKELVPLLRRLGVRTRTEIERERHALKALAGYYDVLDQEAGRPAGEPLHA